MAFVLASAALLAGGVEPAQALCLEPSGNSFTFKFAGDEVQCFHVPQGVDRLTVRAEGGHGGQWNRSSFGGRGGGVQTTIPVTPGERLDVYVGQYGWLSGGWGYGHGGHRGTVPDHVPGHSAAGGGGGTALLRGSTPLVVAGGGGGGGGDANHAGGAGGDGNEPGHRGRHNGGEGGCAGCRPTPDGQHGENDHIGSSGSGGGGGGGMKGGGRGKDATDGTIPDSGGGGGGGGGSYTASGATDTTLFPSSRSCPYHQTPPTCDGALTISWGVDVTKISVAGGNGQGTHIGLPFAGPLRARATDVSGNPVIGALIRFTLPSTGPAAHFANSGNTEVVVTGVDGVAISSQVVSNLVAGTWTAEAALLGGGATPALYTLHNNAARTATSLESAANPSLPGEPVQFRAEVAATEHDEGAPAGQVQFKVDGADLGFPVELENGVALSEPVTDFEVGESYDVRAEFDGTPNYEPSAASLTQSVGKGATATLLGSTPNPSLFGEEVQFTAEVQPVHPAGGTPTGDVTFSFDAAGCADEVVPLTGGQATLTTDDGACLPGGQATRVTATYEGDADFDASAGAMVQQVGADATATTISAPVNPSVFGQHLTFTAHVSDGEGGTPTGIVNFSVDGDPVCSEVVLDNAQASCPVSGSLAPGEHAVLAEYLSDNPGDFKDSTGETTQRVTQARTATTLTAVPDPSVFGQSVRLRAAVTARAPGAGEPGGTVQFSIDGTSLGAPVEVSGGVATSPPVGSLAPGPHAIAAVAGGDADFTGSHAARTTVVKRAATTTTVTSSAGVAAVGEPVSFTAHVHVTPPGAGDPGGVVQFHVDGRDLGAPVPVDAGRAVSEPISTLTAGEHTVVATFAGDEDHAPSDGAVEQRVLGPPAPPGPPPPGPPPPTPPPAGPSDPLVPASIAAVRARTIRVSPRGRVGVRIACTGLGDQRCAGRVVLRADRRIRPTRGGRGSRGRVIPRGAILGARTYGIPAASTRYVTVKLNATGRRAVSRRRAVRTRAVLRPSVGAASGRRTITLRSPRAPGATIVRRAGIVRDGRAHVRVNCWASRSGRCRGRLRIRARLAGRHRTIAGVRFSVRAGRDRTISARLTRRARRALRREGRLRVTVRTTTRIPVGFATRRSSRIALQSR